MAAFYSLIHTLLSIPITKKFFNNKMLTMKLIITKNNGYNEALLDKQPPHI